MNEGAGAIGWRAQRLPHDAGAVYLDRDGVINERPGGGFVLDWRDFAWRPDAISGLRALSDRGWPLVVVSNQSCVGRGLLARRTLVHIMERMTAELERAGVPLAAWYCCPHAPDAGCDCRKPRPGMLLRAARELGLDNARSHMIGDSQRDMDAGTAAGCATHLIDDADPRGLEKAAALIGAPPNAD